MTASQPQIAVFLRSLANGGAERLMVSLVNYFVEKKYKVDLVLTKTDGVYTNLVSPDVRIIDLNAPKLPMSLPKLVRYLQQEQPLTLLTALHYPCEIALWAKQIARVKTRVVVSEHNTLSVEAKHLPQLTARLSPIAARLFYRKADAIVAVSQGVADDLANVTNLSREKIHTIYNPVITPDLLEKAQESVDHPWFAPGELPVVLGVGRFMKQKDFPTLIKAFADVQQQKPCRLMILGEGQEQENLWSLVKDLGLENKVALPGFVNNPYAYMAASAVFVLSSAWEGFGNVLVEAMATGTPVVSTNCPSGPVEILANGKYGELVSVGDSKTMAQAILKVLLGQINFIDPAWLQQFTLEPIAQKYLNILGV